MQSWPRSILVDAGPLIALGRKRDAEHPRALAFAAACESKLVSSWPVIAEVAHFLDSPGRINLYRMVEDKALKIEELSGGDATKLIEITRKFPQADLADATLIVLAERLDILQIATLDETDFSVYRTKSGRHFVNVF